MITIRLENTQEDKKDTEQINRLLIFDDENGCLLGRDIPPIYIPQDIDIFKKIKTLTPYLDGILADKPYRIIHNKPVKGAYSAPLKVFIDINLKCQLNCSFCLSNSGPNHTEEITVEAFTSIADELHEMGVFMVKLGGGEPLIHSNFWEFVKVLRDRYILVSVSSNGYKMTTADIKHIIEFKLKISISIEGNEQTHDSVRGLGSYSKAIKTIEKLATGGVQNIYTRTNLMPANLNDVEHVIQLAKQYNGIAKFNYCKPSGRAATDVKSLITMKETQDYYNAIQILNKPENAEFVSLDEIMMIDQPKSIDELKYGELICGAGKKSIHIATDLGVSPCVFMGVSFKQGTFGIDGNLTDFWRGEIGNAFNGMRNLGKPEDCHTCSRLCAGECPAMRGFSNNGNFLGEDPLCLKNVLKRIQIS